MVRITKRVVDSVDIREKEYAIWDEAFPGFGLRVFPSGKKSYIFQYRHQGRTRKIAIGLHGHWTPAQAYKKAVELRSQINDGRDPSSERHALSNDITMAAFCDFYVENGCDHKKPSTLKTDNSRIARHIKPLLGHLVVSAINAADVEQFKKAVIAGDTALREKTGPRGLSIVKGGQGAAARTLGLLGAIFTFAIKLKLRTDNPAKDVKKPKDRKRDRFLTGDEMVRLGEILENPADLNLHPFVVPALMLLVLTGCRKSEILKLTWAEIDFENKYLHLTDSKTGARKVPLNSEALSILKKIPRERNATFVFPAATGHGHYTALQDGWERIRTAANFNDVHIHDLRHTFATALASNGTSLFMISKLLGHKDQRTTQIYAHLVDASQHEASQAAAEALSLIWSRKGESDHE